MPWRFVDDQGVNEILRRRYVVYTKMRIRRTQQVQSRRNIITLDYLLSKYLCMRTCRQRGLVASRAPCRSGKACGDGVAAKIATGNSCGILLPHLTSLVNHFLCVDLCVTHASPPPPRGAGSSKVTMTRPSSH
mmetsp:Transcript_19759/g.45270  ORF Transcript_19759/g.45270 Transcript_19759/m.45270 type:complete len:133 (-) Transcript_19759:179-577(-)